MPKWLRFRLWEVIVFTAAVAAMFAAGRLVRTAVHRFPAAPTVSARVAAEHIAAGDVSVMMMGVVDDGVVAYAQLVDSPTAGDAAASAERSFIVRLRASDGSVDNIRRLLEQQDVPYSLAIADPGFTFLYPLIGSGLLMLAGLVYLWRKNRARAA